MIKPTSQPPNSQSRPSAPEQPRINVDQFLNSLTAEEKGILGEYLVLEGDDQVRPLLLKHIHGDIIYKLAYGVQELISSHGSNFDTMKRDLQARLRGESRDSGGLVAVSVPPQSGAQESVRQSVQEAICPFSQTIISSIPPPNKNPQALVVQLLSELSLEDQKILREDILFTKDPENRADIKAVRPVTAKFVKGMIDGGIQPSLEVIQRILTETMPVLSEDKKAMVSVSRSKSRITFSPWADEADKRTYMVISEFVDGLSDQQKLVLGDIAKLKRADDKKEVGRLLAKHGVIFSELSSALKRISDQLVCPLRHAKHLAAVRLDSDRSLADDRSSESVDPRKSETPVSRHRTGK